jgi:hypothetical protein
MNVTFEHYYVNHLGVAKDLSVRATVKDGEAEIAGITLAGDDDDITDDLPPSMIQNLQERAVEEAAEYRIADDLTPAEARRLRVLRHRRVDVAGVDVIGVTSDNLIDAIDADRQRDEAEIMSEGDPYDGLG